MNRYIDRYIVALVLMFCSQSIAYSGITLVGPDGAAASTGELTKVQVKTDGATQLSVQVLLNGRPTAQGFSTLKELDDTPVVLFFTKQSGTYTIIASGLGKDGKTQVVIYVLTIGVPVPPPQPQPDPDPQPKPTGFNADVKRLYSLAADPTTLDALVQVFTDIRVAVQADKYKSYGDFETSIAATAADRLKKDQVKLRTVRDRVGDYLIERTGTDPRAWNKDKALATCDDILAALKGCK